MTTTNDVAPPPKRMGLFKKILLGLAVLVAVLVVVIALQPAEFTVQRSTTIDASPEAAFAQVNDFHHWEHWSPWAKIDPNMEATYEGEPTGEGAVYSWSGNNEVGEGRMTIVESHPHELIDIKLEFMSPFEATSKAEFRFVPQGDQTEVTWTMTGENNFIAKAMSLVMDMDSMVGGMFDQGLADLKARAEASSESSSSPDA